MYMTRRRGAVSQAVGAMLHRHRPEEFAVVLHINMPLRCADPPHEVVLLSGDLSATGVRTEGLLAHLEPGSTTWWPVVQLQDAWTRLQEEGLRWLERFADSGKLISHFEEEFTRERAVEAQRENDSLLRRAARRLIGRTSSRGKTPYHEYLLWLAMLYEATGDVNRAHNRLEAYARMSPLVGDERARLERHREALESAHR